MWDLEFSYHQCTLQHVIKIRLTGCELGSALEVIMRMQRRLILSKLSMLASASNTAAATQAGESVGFQDERSHHHQHYQTRHLMLKRCRIESFWSLLFLLFSSPVSTVLFPILSSRDNVVEVTLKSILLQLYKLLHRRSNLLRLQLNFTSNNSYRVYQAYNNSLLPVQKII